MKLNKKRKRLSKLTLIMTIIGAIFISGTATVFASDGSKPGDILYSVDRASEFVRGMFIFGDQAKTEFKFAQATERLEELEILRNNNAPQDIVDVAANNYSIAISEAADKLDKIVKNGGNINESLAMSVAEATSVHLDTLVKVYEKVPEQAKPSIEKAMTSSEQGTERSLDAIRSSVSEQKQQQVEERIQTSRILRGQPENIPANQQRDNNTELDQSDVSTTNQNSGINRSR